MFDINARYFQVNSHDLVYLKFILEAYEGLATLSTIEKEGTIVRIAYPHFSGADLDALLQALSREVAIAEVPKPASYLGFLPTITHGKEVFCAG